MNSLCVKQGDFYWIMRKFAPAAEETPFEDEPVVSRTATRALLPKEITSLVRYIRSLFLSIRDTVNR